VVLFRECNLVVSNHKKRKRTKNIPCPQATYRDATFILALVAVCRRRRYRRGTHSLNVNYDLVKKSIYKKYLWLETRCISSSVRPQVEVVVSKVDGKHWDVLIR
jgi:hypothetical protein